MLAVSEDPKNILWGHYVSNDDKVVVRKVPKKTYEFKPSTMEGLKHILEIAHQEAASSSPVGQ